MNDMKHLLWGILPLFGLLLGGCSDSDEPNGSGNGNDPEKEWVADVAFTLGQVVDLSYQHGMEDLYYMSLSTGDVFFDNTLFAKRTLEDGYVINICLYTASAADPSKPQIAPGSYSHALEPTVGSWSADPDKNVLIESEDGVGRWLTPDEGEITVKRNGAQYDLQIRFEVEGVRYEATFLGELPFVGIGGDGAVVTPLDTEFIGGEAYYHGSDDNYPQYGKVVLELWDSPFDPETGRVFGNLIKCKLYIELPEAIFNGVPAGTYIIKEHPAPFVAAPGYDDGVNIPDGSYISSHPENEPLRLGMFSSGEITVTTEGLVTLDCLTLEGVRIKGTLPQPLKLVDLTGGFAPPTDGNSTLTEDLNLDLEGATVAHALDYGAYYGAGTRNVQLQIFNEVKQLAMIFDLILPEAALTAPIPAGDYTADTGYHKPFQFVPGYEQLGFMLGTFCCDYTPSEDGMIIGSLYGPVNDGSLQIEVHEDNTYTLRFELIDDLKSEPNTIRGEWRGPLQWDNQ